MDALFFLTPAARIAFLLAGAALLVPAVRRGVIAAASRVPSRPVPIAAVLAAGCVGVFWALRSAVPLLGDGLLHLGDLERIGQLDVRFRDITWANNNAPLSNWVLFTLHRAGQALWESSAITFRVLGAASGVLYVAIAVAAAWRLSPSRAGRGLIVGFLLTAGILQHFCGYVEMYALLVPLLLLYGAAGATRADGAPWVAAIVLGVLIALHVATATLLPALLVRAAAGGRGAAGRTRNVALCLAITGGLAALGFAAVGFDPIAYLREPREGNVIPLLAEPTFRHAYRLLDPAHLGDLLSQYLLVAPAALMGLALRRRGPRHPAEGFLLTAAIVPVLFTFLANPEVGAFRDWDVMSFAAIPLTLWVAVGLGRRETGRVAELAVVVVGAAGLHTLAWMTVNADASAAEARFARLLQSCPLSMHAKAYGWESLARVWLADGRKDEACAAFESAARFAPDNPRYWSSAATLHMEAGRAAEAEPGFRKVVELDPSRAEAWLALGVIRYGRDDAEAAVDLFTEAVKRQPDLERAWYNRGLAQERLGRTRDAVASFIAALTARPDFAPAWYNLGALQRDRGEEGEARKAFTRFLQLVPSGPQADDARRWLEAAGDP